MAMLYLTPILPLGPVSYMCGTTSMALSSFVLAKIASLPLMLLYAFIGASTGALIGHGKASQEELQKIEENEVLIVSGIGLSFVMIACITHYIKKELNKVSCHGLVAVVIATRGYRSPVACLVFICSYRFWNAKRNTNQVRWMINRWTTFRPQKRQHWRWVSRHPDNEGMSRQNNILYYY